MPRKFTNAVHRHFEWNERSKYSLCKICGNKLKGNHATNLMNHLRLKHEDKHSEVTEINKSAIKIKEKNNKHENEKEGKRKRLIDCCIRLIAIHGRPFQLLDDKAFRDIKTLISPDFLNEASRKKIKELITDKAYHIKEKISNELKRKMISMKLDSATCMDRQFIGVNIQYIKKSKIIVRNVALREIFVRQTAENLKSIIFDVLSDFHIQLSNLYTITTDNGSNYLKLTTLFNEEIVNEHQSAAVENDDSDDETDEFEQNDNFDSGVDSFDASVMNTESFINASPFQITSVKCAAHTLQLCVKDAIKKSRETESVIESCRAVVRVLRRPLMKIKIRSQKLRKPVIDCSTRWASTYNMLNRLKELKPVCDDSEEIAEAVDENFWVEMNNILESLQPSAEATARLQAEQLTLGDFYSIWIICKNKTEKLNLPLARDILTFMVNREVQLLDNKAFLAAIFIDPRWKIVLSDQETEIAKTWLKDVYQQLSMINQECEEIIGQEHPEDSSALPTTPSCSRDSINLLCSPSADTTYHADLQSLESILNETQQVRASGCVRLNFDYYLAEYATVPRLAITEDVLNYWSHKLPNKLAEVALVVLAVPATQVTVERLFSVLKSNLTPSRNRLLDQTIKNMILIKCNEDLFDDDDN